MSRLGEHLLVVLVTLWVGAMWTVGYVVAPTLFGMIADRTLAGNVAGRLFTLVAWIGLASAVYVLVFQLLRQRWRALRGGLFWLVAGMALMTLASQFGIQPLMAQMKADAWPREVMDSVLRNRFATWHGVSSVLYLIQSVLGVVLVLGARRLLR
jgi:predicted cobalt transporter CbtA